MIWEADETISGSIDYEDMKLMFQRNISDRTGLEPSKMYNLVQFLIFDSNENGKVSVDETMAFLHARYGRAGLEFKLKELFGDDMVESGTEVCAHVARGDRARVVVPALCSSFHRFHAPLSPLHRSIVT